MMLKIRSKNGGAVELSSIISLGIHRDPFSFRKNGTLRDNRE
jgi:hypothetical protein